MSQLSSVPAIILAGGFGTRLRAAFRRGPKCLAPVGRRPFLDYLVGWLRREGIEEVILCVGYRRSQIKRRYGNGRNWGVGLSYSVERSPLGTAGALLNARKSLPTEPFFVFNGDSFLNVDLTAMLAFHNRRQAIATIALVQLPDTRRYGTVRTDRQGRITSFHEKSTSGPVTGWINGGVYLMRRGLFDHVSKSVPQSLETGVFPRLTDGRIFGFRTKGYFIDIGVPADYRRAQRELPRECLNVHSR